LKKSFVYDERGFLLLEHLIAVVIMGIMMVVFLSLMEIVAGFTAQQGELTMHEVNTLAVRIQNEARHANQLTSSDHQLFLHFDHTDDVIGFVISNNRLLRQVNGRGGEIMSYHVTNLNVEQLTDTRAGLLVNGSNGEVFRFSVRGLNPVLEDETISEEIDDEKNITQ